jgi:hypothetical protein
MGVGLLPWKIWDSISRRSEKDRRNVPGTMTSRKSGLLGGQRPPLASTNDWLEMKMLQPS